MRSPCWSARTRKVSTSRAARRCRPCHRSRSACPRGAAAPPRHRAAERTMKAQNAAIGVAVAAYYPAISLSAAAGFEQDPLNGLVHAANHVWSLGANGTETLLDFGERRGEVAGRTCRLPGCGRELPQHRADRFRGRRERSIGTALLASQSRALDTAVKDAMRGTHIAMAEFEAGTVDYTTVARRRRHSCESGKRARGPAEPPARGREPDR